jgi:hypothetical protein
MKVNLCSPYTKLALRVLPIVIAMSLLVAARWLEYTFMPVVKDFHLTSLVRTGNYVVMQGYMRKVRSCRYVGTSAQGVSQDGNVDLPLRFLDADTLSDNSTRPEGTQYWGPWRIIVPASPSVTAIDLHSVHSCHLAWETTTNLARVPLILAEKGIE